MTSLEKLYLYVGVSIIIIIDLQVVVLDGKHPERSRTRNRRAHPTAIVSHFIVVHTESDYLPQLSTRTA